MVLDGPGTPLGKGPAHQIHPARHRCARDAACNRNRCCFRNADKNLASRRSSTRNAQGSPQTAQRWSPTSQTFPRRRQSHVGTSRSDCATTGSILPLATMKSRTWRPSVKSFSRSPPHRSIFEQPFHEPVRAISASCHMPSGTARSNRGAARDGRTQPLHSEGRSATSDRVHDRRALDTQPSRRSATAIPVRSAQPDWRDV